MERTVRDRGSKRREMADWRRRMRESHTHSDADADRESDVHADYRKHH